MKKGKWVSEIFVELDGVSYTFGELQPRTQRRIFRAVGRGNQSGTLTERDFVGVVK